MQRPIAASGFVDPLIPAGLHIWRKEASAMVTTGFLLVLAVLVALGRFGPHGW